MRLIRLHLAIRLIQAGRALVAFAERVAPEIVQKPAKAGLLPRRGCGQRP